MSRESGSGPPPFWLMKLTRASGNAASVGVIACWNSVLVILRLFLSTTFTRPLATFTRSNTRSTLGSLTTMAATLSVAASVCLSVLPGGRVMLIRE